MTIGDKLYELRSSQNMSLREFAEIAGVTHTTIARLEADTFGTQKVYLDTIYKICKHLNYDFDKFLIETGYLNDLGTKTPITTAPMSAPTMTSEESKVLEQYRNLPEQLRKLIRQQLDIYSSPEEILFKPNKKV